MNWDKKVEMIKLGNNSHSCIECRMEFQKYVLEHMYNFDNQAWDMFLNIVELIPDEMKKDVEFYTSIIPVVKLIDESKIDFRSGLRLGLLIAICEEQLKIS